MARRKSNKQVRAMMEDKFNGKWEEFGGKRLLVILEGYFGSCPVHCAMHRAVSIKANQEEV